MIQSVEEMYGRFSSELVTLLPDWRKALADEPDRLQDLECEVHAFFARGADLIVAGLVAVVMMSPELAEASERTRRQFEYPLTRGRERSIRVKLLGGLVMWVASLYCDPRKGIFRKNNDARHGLYVELVQFGFGKGVTPGLQSRVARQAALCPSLKLATEELSRSGLKLDVKSVRRIANGCGEGMLRLRKRAVVDWRAGKLVAGSELAGRHVAVQIDGGRTKIRGKLQAAQPSEPARDADGLPTEQAPGRSKGKPRRTYGAAWREPKLVIIYVHDEHGRMDKKIKATIDGTFEGPDAIGELVAMHLHRLGAAQALSVTFINDGAPWIWDRIGEIARRAGIQSVPRYEILDCCHAAHHISLALAALGLSERERIPLYREHRSLLRNGQWRRVVEELTELASGVSEKNQVHTEIAYLRKHGESNRLSYAWYRGKGLPLGSGSIESSIRRVVNLRLKGNGIFWREANAESMLQLRSQLVSDRWDECVSALREHQRRYRQDDWHWDPQKRVEAAEASGEESG